MRAGLIVLAFVLDLAGAAVLPVHADDALAARVRDVLAAHCAQCRDASTGAAPDLATMARDPGLIQPGNPDGSPAYTTLLRRIGGSGPSPTPDDLGALRSWIESLPAEAATCPSAIFVPRRRIEAELARVAAKLRKPVAALRILSLSHLDLGCATPERRAEWQQLLELVLAAVAGVKHPVATHTLDAQGHNLAFDIQDLGWDAHRWRSVLGLNPQARRSADPLIARADQLVAHVLRGVSGAARAGSGGSAPAHLADDPHMRQADREVARSILGPVTAPDKLERNTELMLQLARHHLAPLSLPRVATEISMRPDALARVLEPAARGDRHFLRQLIYSTVPRHEVEENWPLIASLARVVPPAQAMPLVSKDAAPPATISATPIELILYPDRARYAAGDELRLSVRASIDCHLTLISIDTAGFGTVIFPNDFATNNRIAAQVRVSIPAASARYRFRLKDKGRERVVALCTRNEGSVDGIRHDFERQRFQELGRYTTFLDTALKRSTAPESERSEREKPALLPQSEIWRTGIVIDVR